jgi:trimeric autotransporter adhesin
MRNALSVSLRSLAVAALAVHAAAQAPARSSAVATTASALRQVAYIKASNPGEEDKFGDIVALSGDGNTLAVGAPLESRVAKGINGKGAIAPGQSSGAVYVYTRSGKGWSQQAYIKASNPGSDDQFGYGIGLSADGNTLVVSAPYEDSAATGINGNQDDNSVENSGAVYVFSRSGSTWSQQAYVKASNTGEKDEGDEFGYSVSVSGDGNTLAVGAIGEDSSASGINGNQTDNSMYGAGAVYVFSRSGGTWAQQAYVKSSKPARNIMYGYSVSLSANGDTMAVGEYDADRGRGALYVLTRSGGTWLQQARLQPATLDPQDSMGCSVAISDDGNTIAAGAMDEDTIGPGINVVQGGHSGIVDGPDDNSAGAAYVFVRNGTTWTEQANFKASNVAKRQWFGVRLALSGDGNTLAVGAPNEKSAARGINGKQDDDSADEAGALYVFTRTASTWKQDYYVKGSNTEKYDEFGSSAALSRDGSTMAVGAHFESGGSKGVNGNQADNSVPHSGAAYVFVR